MTQDIFVCLKSDLGLGKAKIQNTCSFLMKEAALDWSLGLLSPVSQFLGRFVIFQCSKKVCFIQSTEDNTYFQEWQED